MGSRIDSARSQLETALRAAGSPERAAQEKRYHKSVWQHWGAPAPAMDAALRGLDAGLDAGERIELASRLWRTPVWDLRIVAGRLLRAKQVPPDAALWRFVTDRMDDLDGWAVADNFADVAARCLIADETRLDEVEAFVASPHLWTRRAALVFTLPWAKGKRDPERMLGWAGRLVPDREWFIQKAIGWWLRELSKRDPDRVRRFLAEHGGGMKAFARKEAEKYLGRPRRGG
jgi:3-methyladenine DNA glycosylase AlkD